ncbi:MAG: hypothetical protein ACR2KP_01790 [Egibacteraceae bacterium]
MTDDHTLDELASAHLDGVTSAAEEALIRGNPELLARVEQLRAARTAVHEEPAADPARREQAIAAALSAFDELQAAAGEVVPDAVRVRKRWGAAWRNRRPVGLGLVGAVAAVVAVAVLVPVLTRDEPARQVASEDATASAPTAGGRASDAAGGVAENSADSGAGSGGSASPSPFLGEFEDLDALLAVFDEGGPSADFAAPEANRATATTSPVADDCRRARDEEARSEGAESVEAFNAVLGDQRALALLITDGSGVRTLRVYAGEDCALVSATTLDG